MRCWSAMRSALACACLVVLPFVADAQVVLGPQDDALVLPQGVLRIRLLNQWVSFNERYGKNTPGRPDGAIEPLGTDFNLDTVGVSTFRNLAPLQAGLRQLTGIPDFTLSLGRTVLTADARLVVTPVVFEYGVTERFSMGLVLPYVQSKNTIFFNVNPLQREGNVGFNPALGGVAPALAANAAVQTQFATAAAQLQGALAACNADPGQPGCAQLLAQEANANNLIQSSTLFAGGLADIYGTGTAGTGSPFIPITGTDVQLAIQARIAAFNALYRQFLGSGTDILTATPFPAQNRLTLNDAQTILTDPAFGIAGEPLQTVERSGIGDIELGAKYLIFDTMRNRGLDRLDAPPGLNFRVSAGAIFRFGTGDPDSPNNFADVGVGNGQHDLQLNGFADVLYGKHIFTSFAGRYGIQFADQEVLRVTDAPERRLAALWRRQEVERDLGDYFELEANQRFILNDYFSVTGHYLYRHKFEDRYSGTFQIDSAVTGYADVTLNASTLDQETELIEHRLGGGFSFSTVAAFFDDRARIPIEVTYFHFQTTRGFGGNTPKLFSDQIQVRVYTRLFGGP